MKRKKKRKRKHQKQEYHFNTALIIFFEKEKVFFSDKTQDKLNEFLSVLNT